MESLSVAIINLNGRKYLKRCLDSLFKQTYGDFEVILFDNASRDDSVDFVRKNYPGVRIVANEKNIGFAPAINRCIDLSAGKYFMSLNADIYLTDTFIHEMIKTLEGDGSIGSVTGKMYKMTPDGELKDSLDSAGHFIKRDRKVIGTRVGFPYMDDEYNSRYQFVFGAPASASIYKREMLEDIKVGEEYFDNDFFAFFEDIDVDWRALLRGWKCRYTPNAVGYHVRGGTGVRKNPRIEALLLRNGYLTIIKNDNLLSVLKHAPAIASRIFRENRQRGLSDMRIPFYVLRLFFTDMVKMMKKRMVIQRQRKLSSKVIEQWVA